MKSLIAFIKKELLEQIRTGKVMILGALFVLFGIMNPAIAKLTPWLLETLTDSLAESGMIVTEVTVSALDSWVQFFKNIPMALIAYVLIESSIFTKEYQSGTLLLSLTKGFERYKVVLSKTIVLSLLWTVGYWMCFGITYAYNTYFWDNSIAQHLILSVVCWWLFGMWVIALLILCSTIMNTNAGVLMGTSGVVLISYVLGFLPKIKPYVPTSLTNGTVLIYGVTTVDTYFIPLILVVIMCVICFITSILLFNKKLI